MPDENLSDEARRLLITALMKMAMNDTVDGRPGTKPREIILTTLSQLSGTDTVLIARREYPSRNPTEDHRHVRVEPQPRPNTPREPPSIRSGWPIYVPGDQMHRDDD